MTEETVNAEADKVLASITNPDMTQYEILKAIYEWCHSQIAFVDEAPKDDWVTGAYYGLILRKGDCFAYAMTAKCLLTRAGIPNMDIQRIPHGIAVITGIWWISARDGDILTLAGERTVPPSFT